MARKVESIDNIESFIGKRIKILRLSKGMSRQELGELVSVSHQQLNKYERGENRISAGRLAIFAKALSTPISYFYEDTEGDNLLEVTTHQRLAIEVSRNFMKIADEATQDAIGRLVLNLSKAS